MIIFISDLNNDVFAVVVGGRRLSIAVYAVAIVYSCRWDFLSQIKVIVV
jgi:hypothetical protein